MNERSIQSVLMDWAMLDKNHQVVLPNTYMLSRAWEADLVSITRAWLLHEYEIKLCLSDFRADKEKRAKHWTYSRASTGSGFETYSPNYFWYATYGFEVPIDELPEWAGWIEIVKKRKPIVVVRRPAIRMHSTKLRERTRADLSRWLSFKIAREYRVNYSQNGG